MPKKNSYDRQTRQTVIMNLPYGIRW